MKEQQEAVKNFSDYLRYASASVYSTHDGDKQPVSRGEFYSMMNHLDYVLNTLVPKSRRAAKRRVT